MKKILILATKLGYQTRGFADAARKLDIEVLFGTDRCHQLEDPWADSAIPLRFEDARGAAAEIMRAVRDHPPDAILALGDRPTPAAAFAARALRLPGNHPDSVEACRNKFRQRQALRAAGLPVLDFFAFRLGDDLAFILPRVVFPCVVKPVGLAASTGVIRANNKEEFAVAVRRIRALLETPEIQVLHEPNVDQILVEKYVPGAEVAIEGLITEGKLRILAIFDKPDPLEGPYFEETIYTTPSRLPASQQEQLRGCAAAAVRAMGLITGPVHAEFRINDAGPWVIEVAARPIGGLCSRALRFGAEHISLEELLLRHLLGMQGGDLEREEVASGVMMIPVSRSGIFEGVEGVDNARRTYGVTEIEITARAKDYVAAWPEGSSYLGFIFARGKSPDGVERALRLAHAKLKFHFSPRLPVEHPVTHRMTG